MKYSVIEDSNKFNRSKSKSIVLCIYTKWALYYHTIF
jgi:hypothetical protein